MMLRMTNSITPKLEPILVGSPDVGNCYFTLPPSLRWLDSDHFGEGAERVRSKPVKTRFSRWFPFAFLHAGVFAVFFVGWSPIALATAVALYWLRMFAVTAFLHRYFSHRTFKTSRTAQFIFALMACSAVQRGPLWWAAHHRAHHKLSDKDGDLHSPSVSGFIWSHIGWITADCNMPTDYEKIPDLARYPELVLLNRFDWFVPVLLGCSLLLFGYGLQLFYPQLGTNPWQMLVWGFFVSTVLLFHGTASINSLTHMFGSQRYKTGDQSRNNFFLALITMGEGWHNNHHYFPGAARQGFYWWEVDFSFYLLKLLAALGIIWQLRPVPAEAYSHSSLKTSGEATT